MTDYTGQNLTGQSFVGQNLTNANFTNATLTNADLSGCNLTNAIFTGAITRNTNIVNTTLSGVTFSGVQAAQLLYNNSNVGIAYLTTQLTTQLTAPGLPAVIGTILTDDVSDLSAGVDIIAATVAGEGIRTVAAITVDPKRAFYISGISLANNDSLTLNISGIQSIGTVNNPTLVINYPAKTFTVSRDHSGNTTIVDTTGGGATTVTDALLRIGNVVYKIHGFTMIGIPYDLNVYKIVNVGLYDVLTNSDYLDGRTGATGARGFTGTNGVVGATGPTGAGSADGATGSRGPTGATGSGSDIAPTGPIGSYGATGPDGTMGTTGLQGPTGDSGAESGIGATGPTGEVGATGPTGEDGIAGVIANAGATGPAGLTGSTGLSGAIAGLGATGPMGPTGATNSGVWSIINPDTPETTTGYTNIRYYIPPLEGGGATRTTVGVNTSGVENGTAALDIRYTMDISGSIKTIGMNSVSDYRIKRNICDLTRDKTVDGLHPVMYMNRLTGHEEYGFLAHELQGVYPEMVVGEKDDPNGYQTIQYEQLFAIFIAEIKRLRADIERMEADVGDNT
jgi:hypothetical protein